MNIVPILKLIPIGRGPVGQKKKVKKEEETIILHHPKKGHKKTQK